MRSVGLLIAAVMLFVLAAGRPASAILPFYNVFKAEYLDSHPDEEFAAMVNKGTDKCFVCHQGKQRKNHNAFGQHLVEMLDRKTDARDTEKIKAALAKVLAMPVDPHNDESETYADRVKAGKWPAGELDDLKKEPPEEPEEVAGN